MNKYLLITILVDSPSSWYVKYAKKLVLMLENLGHNTTLVHDKNCIKKGDICFMLSCTKILPEKFLLLNKQNIVVHASDLPKGRGFSPLQWQIENGFNKIPLTLFEAVKELDAGDYYLKDSIQFEGHELLNEMHKVMAEKINEMVLEFVKNLEYLKPKKQVGISTFFPKRTINDDRLDPNKTIQEQFNKMRVANNETYPVFFELNGFKYNLIIEKRDD